MNHGKIRDGVDRRPAADFSRQAFKWRKVGCELGQGGALAKRPRYCPQWIVADIEGGQRLKLSDLLRKLADVVVAQVQRFQLGPSCDLRRYLRNVIVRQICIRNARHAEHIQRYHAIEKTLAERQPARRARDHDELVNFGVERHGG